MPPYDLAIIGAGISGLTFAHDAVRAGLRAIVFEKNATPGGALFTVQTSENFWIELGAHTLYNSYGSLLRHMTTAGLMEKITPRKKARYRMLVAGQLRSIRSQLSLGELFTSAFRAFTTHKEGHTVSEYYGRIVGSRNWQRVARPLLSAVPSQPADDFPANLLFKPRKRRKDLPRSFTLEGGLSTLIRGLVENPAQELRTQTRIRTLEKRSTGFCLTTDQDENIECQKVVLAVDPAEASRLLQSSFPALADPLRNIRVVAIDSVGVALRKEHLGIPLVAGIIPERDDFFSVVSRDVLPHPTLRGMTFHFRSGLSENERLRKIATVLAARQENFISVAQRTTVLPSLSKEHTSQVDALDANLGHSGIFLTGNYFGGLAIEDCVLRTEKEWARLISERK